ncbi:MAG: hypothetical protein KKF44_10915 [Nanoarchaeota archaeon]|nr:hypothetical protein [Nanoarchaeota archaeon]
MIDLIHKSYWKNEWAAEILASAFRSFRLLDASQILELKRKDKTRYLGESFAEFPVPNQVKKRFDYHTINVPSSYVRDKILMGFSRIENISSDNELARIDVELTGSLEEVLNNDILLTMSAISSGRSNQSEQKGYSIGTYFCPDEKFNTYFFENKQKDIFLCDRIYADANCFFGKNITDLLKNLHDYDEFSPMQQESFKPHFNKNDKYRIISFLISSDDQNTVYDMSESQFGEYATRYNSNLSVRPNHRMMALLYLISKNSDSMTADDICELVNKYKGNHLLGNEKRLEIYNSEVSASDIKNCLYQMEITGFIRNDDGRYTVPGIF